MRLLYRLLLIGLSAFAVSLANDLSFAQDNPKVDTPIARPGFVPMPTPARDGIQVVTTPDGFDNFDIGVDFAEPHMSSNPRSPLWHFNAFNTTTNAGSNSHNTINGHDWTTTNPAWTDVMRGDPVTAYDSLGNLYFEQMYGTPNILGTRIAKSTDNGRTWVSIVNGNTGNDKNWIAADQTMGPYANYVYGTMTPGNVIRSTNQGVSFQITASMSNTLPGMMPAVGPNVLGGNNIPGGCVYVVTNTGSSFAATFTFYASTDGGATFQFKSAQNFANYVGTNVSGRNSVHNMRTRPYPFIAADNSYGPFQGRLYLVYASNVPAGDGNKPDIFCRYSTDQAVTWSSEVKINDDPNTTNNHQWFPSIWTDKQTGRLWVKWLDTRNTPTTDSCEVYASYSDDGGTTFVTNQKISNRKFRINCTTCGGGGTPAYLGDYDAITSNPQGSTMVWTDFRNGNFGNYVAYFPDFAMLTSRAADTLKTNDSINVRISVPAVRLYTRTVKFSATVTPAAPITLTFLNGRDSLTNYPDSVTLRVRTNNAPTGLYTLTITGAGPNGTPVHKRTVALTVANAFVAVQQPNGGEQMFTGTTYPITWAKFSVDSVKLEYSTNRGASWLLITAGVPARPFTIKHPKLPVKGIEPITDGSEMAVYNWSVPNTPSSNCLVRVSDKNNSSVFDTSNAPFSIVAAPAAAWNPQITGASISFYSVSVVDTSTAWAAGDSGRVYRTLNGGGLWSPRTSVTNTVSNIAAVSSTVALVASNAPNNARILRTGTGGLTWTTVYQDTNSSAYIDAIKMFDANNGYAVGDPVNGRWTLLRTTDGGLTWVKRDTTLLQAGSEFGWGNSMSWIGSQNGWFGTNNSRVYRTTDGGITWSSGTTSFVQSYAVAFATNLLGMTAGTGSAQTNNGGATWTNTTTPPIVPIFGNAGLDLATDRWYLIAGAQILKTTDRGTTFTSEYGQFETYQHIDMKVVNVGGNNWIVGYAVGELGSITKYIELLTTSDVSSFNGVVPVAFSLEQNYPNPFNPSTTIKFGIPAGAPLSETTTLRVFDVLGREVATLVNEKLAAGTYAAKFETGGIASGIYFYRLSSGRFVETKKMMLIK